MAFTAKQFQNVLDIVKKWHDQGLRDLLVNGQLALTYEEVYISKYSSKAGAFSYGARIEEQSRGIPHLHYILKYSSEACALNYILKYTSKACPLNYEAVFEQQSRGMQHFH